MKQPCNEECMARPLNHVGGVYGQYPQIKNFFTGNAPQLEGKDPCNYARLQ